MVCMHQFLANLYYFFSYLWLRAQHFCAPLLRVLRFLLTGSLQDSAREMDVTITHEEEEFCVNYSNLAKSSKEEYDAHYRSITQEAPGEAMKSDAIRHTKILTKLKSLVEITEQKYGSLPNHKLEDCPGQPRFVFVPNPSASQLESYKAHEMTARQTIENLCLLLRMPPTNKVDRFERMMEKSLSTMALLITAQKANRDAEAQRIYLELLVKSLARHGPRNQDTITFLINLAQILIGQEQKVMGCNILRMAHILLKHGGPKGTWLDASSQPEAEQLRKEIIHYLQAVPNADATLEPLLREQREACETAAQKQGGDAKSREDTSSSLVNLGSSLLTQGKFLEAEGVLEKALAMSLEQEGLQLLTNDPGALQGMGVKDLMTAMRRLRVTIPQGLEKADLVQLYVEESRKALARNEMTFQIMSSLAQSLLGQRDAYPDKLPRAERLLRQVLEAKMSHPEYGPKDGGTLTTMNDLKDVLSCQFKFVEALSIGEKTLAIRKRLYRDSNHPAFQSNLQRQQEDLQNQKLFRTNAEKILGPRSAWEGNEDGEPAAVMFKKAVQEAHKRRSTNADRSTSMAVSTFQPVEFDPTDEADINYAVLMAGYGVSGMKWTEFVGPGGQRAASYMFHYLTGDSKNLECTKLWATIVKLVEASMGSSLPSGPPDSPAEKKKIALGAALRISEHIQKEVDQALKRASESRDAMKQKEEEASREGGSQSGQIPPTKPIKICCGCGSYGAKKRCSQCMQVYACSVACFNAAWDAYHKHACKRQDKK